MRDQDPFDTLEDLLRAGVIEDLGEQLGSEPGVFRVFVEVRDTRVTLETRDPRTAAAARALQPGASSEPLVGGWWVVKRGDYLIAR